MTISPSPSGDGPIASPGDDLLDRSRFVQSMVHQALAVPTGEGFVVGLTGAWGSGKTSVLRLIEQQVPADVPVVRFNPWLYSTDEDLIIRFLVVLRSQLPERLAALRDRLAHYAAVIRPMPGLIGGVAGIAKEVLGTSAEEQRDEICRLLASAPERVIVMIDDLDRLAPAEVADVVRLVKLVADFPSVTYILSFDRRQVEKALESAHGGDGKDYLDKIVQATYPLPYVSPARLGSLLDSELRRSLPGEFATGDRWTRLLAEVVAPLLRTVRDVRRLLNVAVPAIALIEGEVDSSDVIALEALRLFRPEVHDRLIGLRDALTRVALFPGIQQDDRDRPALARATRRRA